MTDMVLLGDEAVALGAIHAGVSAAYAYPGTPSTEILEYLIQHRARKGKPYAAWCANEKTAYEEALGVSFAGRRALVSMKHVGLNVAADPFINSALVPINGGLVVAVADDPGMHSSQNEQDSRFYADFARVICLEPTDQQQAYEMTREAFDLSEGFEIPVMVRLVTRLAHSRTVVRPSEPREENPLDKAQNAANSWVLMPHIARERWHSLLLRQREIHAYSESSPYNKLILNEQSMDLGVITTGVARNYFEENLQDLACVPSHLHVGAYPIPAEKVRQLAARVERVLILEEGYPFLERSLRGIIPPSIRILGRESGDLPMDGELTPDLVRRALGLPRREILEIPGLTLAARPPQLCAGCPHCDTLNALNEALSTYQDPVVTSDIGCYTLGALPPYSAVESCVCMGASVGMAKGAAEAGLHPVVAVIGDSTFLHSGVTPLMDAVAANADMTLVIADNGTVAMTGTQPTILPQTQLQQVVLGTGVDPRHFQVLTAHRKNHEENTRVLKREIDYRGLSVIISRRECLEAVKLAKSEGGAE
ncbi:MAG TPA: thiamine pyrophosphate-dependent enzyme [Acidobacteriota bacterium]|nr:thiamine pyrophosphate-dependent enzyme [Acidobacteriota bacterium]